MPDDQVTTENLAAREADWLDASEELPPRPRRRMLAPLPLGLLGVLLVACGFIAGVLVEKGQTRSPGNSAGGGLAARFSALRGGAGVASASAARSSSGGFAGRLAGAAGGGRPMVGQVSYVDGHTLYVENSEGNTVKVTTSAGSRVTKTVTSSVRSIHPGETVVVQGSSASNGAIAASSISVGGSGGLGRGLGALFGK